MQIEFGALLESSSLSWNDGQIEPLPDLDEVKRTLSRPSCSHDGWIYPPLIAAGHSGHSPLKPTSFALPPTHQLTLDGEDHDKAHFIIAVLGMLKGLRLQRPNWQHFYKAPLDRKLNDFFASNREIETALSIASTFWDRHPQPETRKLIFGALHWHLFAQLYEHEFERFNAQYAALDACSKLAIELGIPGIM